MSITNVNVRQGKTRAGVSVINSPVALFNQNVGQRCEIDRARHRKNFMKYIIRDRQFVHIMRRDVNNPGKEGK